MIKDPKKPKSLLRRMTGAVVAAEGIAVLGTYIIWRGLNRDQENRFRAYNSFPWALEFYYTIGETVEPDNKIREYDMMIWQKEGRLQIK